MAGVLDPNLARAVKIAGKEVGGDIDFSSQSHREALGRAVIRVARSNRNYCNGSKIRRC